MADSGAGKQGDWGILVRAGNAGLFRVADPGAGADSFGARRILAPARKVGFGTGRKLVLARKAGQYCRVADPGAGLGGCLRVGSWRSAQGGRRILVRARAGGGSWRGRSRWAADPGRSRVVARARKVGGSCCGRAK